MRYEAVQDSTDVDAWRVEAIDGDHSRARLVAEFAGPYAEECAHEYEEWKSSLEPNSTQVH